MGCTATIGPCPTPDSLESVWRDLEGRADPTVFLSWAWIGTLVSQFGAPAFLAKIQRDDELVGLALLGWRRGRWADWLRRPSLHLNETGDAAQDRIWIEYNGVLAACGNEDAAAAALVAALRQSRTLPWREWHLSGVDGRWVDLCRNEGLIVRLSSRPQAAPLACFTTMAADDLLNGFSRNTRQQLRRSLRHYEERGALTLMQAGSVGEAQDWLTELAELHSATWRARGQAGAFAEPNVMAFHRALIERCFDIGVPDLLSIRAGGEVIGYLYNFRWRSWVYSYQSGLRYEAGADSRPGLVCHLLAMRHYRKEGLVGYRFLAGLSRYKTSLSTKSDTLSWLVACRPDWGHRLERWARACRDRFQTISR